jgi:hypothetical protein
MLGRVSTCFLLRLVVGETRVESLAVSATRMLDPLFDALKHHVGTIDPSRGT